MISSLRQRNYRLFFFGQLVSVAGTFRLAATLPERLVQLDRDRAPATAVAAYLLGRKLLVLDGHHRLVSAVLL
jgi:hypothetical protein